MRVDGSVLKDLEIFQAVAEANGIANAQYVLNRDASTISRSISALENRLGMIICERGRAGFKLTEQGKLLLDEAQVLFQSCRQFERKVGEMNQTDAISLRFGIIDNIISDEACPLHPWLTQWNEPGAERIVNVDFQVQTPYELEKSLLNHSLDLALGIFERHHNALNYQVLYEETDYLFAASHSEIARQMRVNPTVSDHLALLASQHFCARKFLNQNDLSALGFSIQGEISYTDNLEAITFKVLSGACIAFLPDHYAQPFVDKGQLTPLSPAAIYRNSPVSLVWRKDEEQSSVFVSQIIDQCGHLTDQNCR